MLRLNTSCFLQIMRLFSVAPFDQNLTLETGQCLDDDKATLADLRILPGSLIYLKVSWWSSGYNPLVISSILQKYYLKLSI